MLYSEIEQILGCMPDSAIQFILPNMSPQFSEQASQLWKTVSEPETVKTYRSTISLSWKILSNIVHLLWLAICSIIVLFDWGNRTSRRSIQWIQQGIQAFQARQSEDLLFQTKAVLLSASKEALKKTVTVARRELGLPAEPTPLLSTSTAGESQVAVASPLAELKAQTDEVGLP